MPYIKQGDRAGLKQACDHVEMNVRNAGELNYAITRIVDQYLNPKRNARYNDYNEVMGVLACVQQELYRRVIVPYEDEKRAENGDVYVP